MLQKYNPKRLSHPQAVVLHHHHSLQSPSAFPNLDLLLGAFVKLLENLEGVVGYYRIRHLGVVGGEIWLKRMIRLVLGVGMGMARLVG